MNIVFQHIIKLKEYILTLDYRRLISICLISLFILLFYTFRQYPNNQFPHLVYKPLNSTKNATSQLTKMIVVSHFNEDLDWLDLFLGEQIPHIVYTRSTDSLIRHSISINKGREAAVYLRYIVDYYSKLPSLIAFVHGHRTSWHQKDPSDIVIALRALQWNKHNYMPLTSTMTQARFKPNTRDPQVTVNYELWRDVLQEELGLPPENGIRTHCCASFVVKREVILAHPKIFYLRILDYILASRYSDQLTGRTLEYTWHMIFGQPAFINYQTCDIFVCDVNGRISVQLAEMSE